MANERDQLIRLLRAAAQAINASLIILENGGAISDALLGPSGVPIPPPVHAESCAHKRRSRAMGGYWHCLDCGASGHDEGAQ